MSVREERIILAAAALISMGRDDRHTPDSKAASAVAQADAVLSRLDETEGELGEPSDEDSDDDASDPVNAAFERGYEQGEKDNETRVSRITEARDELRAEVAALKKLLEVATAPKQSAPPDDKSATAKK